MKKKNSTVSLSALPCDSIMAYALLTVEWDSPGCCLLSWSQSPV